MFLLTDETIKDAEFEILDFSVLKVYETDTHERGQHIDCQV